MESDPLFPRLIYFHIGQCPVQYYPNPFLMNKQCWKKSGKPTSLQLIGCSTWIHFWWIIAKVKVNLSNKDDSTECRVTNRQTSFDVTANSPATFDYLIGGCRSTIKISIYVTLIAISVITADRITWCASLLFGTAFGQKY